MTFNARGGVRRLAIAAGLVGCAAASWKSFYYGEISGYDAKMIPWPFVGFLAGWVLVRIIGGALIWLASGFTANPQPPTK